MRPATFRSGLVVGLLACLFSLFQPITHATENTVTYYHTRLEWQTDLGAVSDLAWSLDGHWLAATSLDGELQIWDASDGHVVNTMKIYSGPLYSLAWSPDGKALVTGGYDGTIRLWDPQEGREACIFMGHGRALNPGGGNANGVSVVRWSPDGKLIASGGYDGTLRLWDTTTTTPCNLLQPLIISTIHPFGVHSIGWNAVGDQLLSLDILNVVPIWDAKSGKQVDSIACPFAYTADNPCHFFIADWNTDGKTILASGGNGFVSFSRIWDVMTKESRGLTLPCATNLRWMPKGHALIGWCEAHLLIYDADTQKMIATTEIPSQFWEEEGHLLSAYAVSPDEQQIALSYQQAMETKTIIQLLSLSPSGSS